MNDLKLKASELNVIEEMFYSKLQATSSARYEANKKKNAPQIKKLKRQMDALKKQETALEAQMDKLYGARARGSRYHSRDKEAWLKLKVELMFAKSVPDIEKLVAKAVSEALK